GNGFRAHRRPKRSIACCRPRFDLTPIFSNFLLAQSSNGRFPCQRSKNMLGIPLKKKPYWHYKAGLWFTRSMRRRSGLSSFKWRLVAYTMGITPVIHLTHRPAWRRWKKLLVKQDAK